VESADRTAACVVSRLVVGPWEQRAVVLGAAVRVFAAFLKINFTAYYLLKKEKRKKKSSSAN